MGVSFSSDEKKENVIVDAKSTARQEATTRRRTSSASARSSNATPNSNSKSWTIDEGEWESADHIHPPLSPSAAAEENKTEKRKD